MSLVSKTVTWLFDGNNWTGINGIPRLTLAHVEVTGLSLIIAAVIALPLGIGFGHGRRGGRAVTVIANVSRAVPPLALIILLASEPAFGVNTRTAVVALAIFAIPPMLINAYTGVRNVDPDIIDAAKGQGMTGAQVLRNVEVPLALPLIAAGVRISALQTFASATIASFAGTRTLGTIIQIAQATQQQQAVLGGAFVVAALALILDFLLSRFQAALSTGPGRAPRARFGRGATPGDTPPSDTPTPGDTPGASLDPVTAGAS